MPLLDLFHGPLSERRPWESFHTTYLSRGIGLIVVDVVTSRQGNLHNDRQGNLHNEMIGLLGWDAGCLLPGSQSLVAVSYRPLNASAGGRIETWPQPLAIGQTLPTLPLSLAADHCVPVDLEAAYREACQRRRIELWLFALFSGSVSCLRVLGSPDLLRNSALLTLRETCHDVRMPRTKQLQQLYRFPGFVPEAKVRGLFGDRMAVVIRLRRRRKKRPAESAARSVEAPTTNAGAGCATCRAATAASTSLSGGGGWLAPAAKP